MLITSFCYSQAGWYVQTQLISEELRGEFFINSQTGWVFGFLNTIKKTTNGGINWFYQNGNTSESFLGGYFINSQTGWLCGGTENQYHTQISKTTDGGNNWNTIYFHNSNGLAYSIQFYNSNTGWVSLQYGKILKTIDGGNSWNLIPLNVTNTLVSLFFINQYTGWVVGTNGFISKTTNSGENWISQQSPTTQNLQSVFFINQNTGIISGNNGTILKTTNSGINWIQKASPESVWLNSVFFINSGTGWIVGGNYNGGVSTILNTIDGGETWNSQFSPVVSWLADVHFVDINTGWACGKNGVIIKTINGGFIIPPPPVLLSPPNGSLNINTTPTLTWNPSPSATHYKVLISTNSNFSLIIDSATVSSNYYTVPNGKLQLGFTYYWKVNASNPYGISDWSTVWDFSTGQYPEAPNLISPPNGTFGTSTTPTLSWTPQTNIIYYKVQISTLPNFLTITDSATVTNSEYTVPSGKLFINITYFWRVNATNSFGTGPWSNIWSFIPYPNEIKKINKELPIEYKLYQNYPNPFNPYTNIKFDLPQKSKVKIILYDLLGKTIQQLINSDLNEGVYEYRLNCENLSGSIYFVKMETVEYTGTIKIIILK